MIYINYLVNKSTGLNDTSSEEAKKIEQANKQLKKINNGTSETQTLQAEKRQKAYPRLRSGSHSERMP